MGSREQRHSLRYPTQCALLKGFKCRIHIYSDANHMVLLQKLYDNINLVIVLKHSGSYTRLGAQYASRGWQKTRFLSSNFLNYICMNLQVEQQYFCV